MTKKHGPLAIGPLSEKGKRYGSSNYKPEPVVLSLPDKVTNATSQGTYSAKRDLSYRGMDVRLPSKGWRC